MPLPKAKQEETYGAFFSFKKALVLRLSVLPFALRYILSFPVSLSFLSLFLYLPIPCKKS